MYPNKKARPTIEALLTNMTILLKGLRRLKFTCKDIFINDIRPFILNWRQWSKEDCCGLHFTKPDYTRLLWTMLDHSWLYQILLDYFEQYWSIHDYTGLYWTILGYCELYRTILDQQTLLDHIQPFRTILNYNRLISNNIWQKWTKIDYTKLNLTIL